MMSRKKTGDGAMGRLDRYKRHVGFVCLIGLTGMTSGCYGRFPMTHALYNMNGDIDNKVVKNIAFWLLVIFPVYWFAQVGDAVIFNLIEFWTGAGLDLSSVTTEGDTTITLQTKKNRTELEMTVSKIGESDVTSRFVRMDDGNYEMRDDENNVMGHVLRTAEGDLNLTDAEGTTLRTIGAAQLAGYAGG